MANLWNYIPMINNAGKNPVPRRMYETTTVNLACDAGRCSAIKAPVAEETMVDTEG